MGFATILIGLLPFITSTVKAVEGIFGAGNGTQKKQAAVAAISDVLNIFNSVHPSVSFQSSDLMAGVAEVIDGVVKILNATGEFAKTQKVG